MDFWPEFLASSWGREFVAGGFGGIAGIISGYPLDTLRIHQQNSNSGSAFRILKTVVKNEGPAALYRGMGAPLASVTIQKFWYDLLSWFDVVMISSDGFCSDSQSCHYPGILLELPAFKQCYVYTNLDAAFNYKFQLFICQNAVVFQMYAITSRAFDSSVPSSEPPSYKGVALGGFGTGAIQSLILTPVELIKIRLQLLSSDNARSHQADRHKGPVDVARSILRREGLRGLYRGFAITVLRDAPSHGFYFWTYEYMREQLHPGCRKNCQESLRTMLMAGGLAGVASWVCCYPLDVMKTRLQAQSQSSPKYSGIIDCFRKSVKAEGYSVLWRGLGTAVSRAFLVNGAVFSAYEIALRCLFSNGNIQTENRI
ncbi:hypothetical protein JRO89_XS09G0164100 [Xanthoceras sorbifolium]|uniref:Mitochondrial arginine transporter BAC2-like n=1 Tax=Xanthoceras sorbifolium TaxID=99658 RepID=A0ABQ8HLH3_9ROSI|nr:hypothetical protein JRO89_XS09G0164100 [Xanthoceras sorbifolium]